MAQKYSFANPDLVVDSQWLSQHFSDANLRIVDMRRKDKYLAAHIPNSINLPVALLSDPDSPKKWMVLPKEKIEPLLGDLGIGNDNLVVVVDEDGGLYAARLFWMLEYYGHDKVCLLEGGYIKWSKEGREVTDKVPNFPKGDFKAMPNPELIATKAQVMEKLGKPGVIIVDARLDMEYSGELEMSARNGHIPGAVNINWEENRTAERIALLRPAAELKSLYEAAGVTPDKEVIVYCQVGDRSAYTYFVLRLLGYPEVRNYDGSWLEWGNDPQTPIEK